MRFALLRSHAGVPFRALQDDLRHDGVGLLTLLLLVGLPHTPFTAGKGGRGRGSPRLPSMEAISAVSSPHTNAPAPMRTSRSKGEISAKDVLPQEAELTRLRDGNVQVLHGNRIFRAAVDITHAGADGVGSDNHAHR